MYEQSRRPIFPRTNWPVSQECFDINSKSGVIKEKDYLEYYVNHLFRLAKHQENKDRFVAPRMRDHARVAARAKTLNNEIWTSVEKFLARNGNLDDACEILASHIGDKAFRRIAIEKFGFDDPLDV